MLNILQEMLYLNRLFMSFIYLIRNKVTLNDLLIYLIFRPTELLTADDRAQLSSWIGQKCHFELLYKISRDSCCPKKFHQLCDGKGHTVTILYNTDNTAYGGFLSQSWESSGGCIRDKRAFLFTLSYNGVRKSRRFPLLNQIKQHLHIII